MSSSPSVHLECKKLCVRRCCYAVLYCLAAQFLLLATFLLFTNFSPLHPVDWLCGTVAAAVSWRTWLSAVPLLGAVTLHGILLGKSQLAERHHHANRFVLITRTAAPQAALFAVHLTIGVLTAWLYAGFLPVAYAHLYAECAASPPNAPQRNCLNERYAFLLATGGYTAVYYFVRERVRKPVVFVTLPIVQQPLLLEMRSIVRAIVGRSLRTAVLPTVVFACVGYVVGGTVFAATVAHLWGVERAVDGWTAGMLMDPLQWLWMFVLAAQIIANMRLMDHLFNALLTERMEFAIEAPQRQLQQQQQEGVTLVQALAAERTPIVQDLAALDVSELCAQTAAASKRRQLVFSLSVPGGHPYNWSALSAQCLALIDGFRADLQAGVEKVLLCGAGGGGNTSQGRSPTAFPRGPAAALVGLTGARSMGSLASETASEQAAKLMMRQYNETYGIRNMTAATSSPNIRPAEVATKADPCRRFNATVERVAAKWEQLKAAVLRLPGIHYLFGVDETARLAHLLATRCESTANTVQGLAGLAVHSLHEDRYGVVQADLARIVGALLRLRTELDKLGSVPFVGAEYEAAQSERVGPQLRAAGLRGTVRRSLGQLAAVFGEYLPDLLEDAREVRVMDGFAQFRET